MIRVEVRPEDLWKYMQSWPSGQVRGTPDRHRSFVKVDQPGGGYEVFGIKTDSSMVPIEDHPGVFRELEVDKADVA